MTTIAIDAMGGDRGLSVTIPAMLEFLSYRRNVNILLVGDQTKIAEILPEIPARVKVCHTPDIVAMDESPLHALKFNKRSSMRIALELVKTKQADACISAGNTGALVANAKFVLKMIKGLKRPALVAMSPSTINNSKSTLYLDVGATVDSSPKQLHQFAVMGVAASKALTGYDLMPTVALLNIGKEDIKGTDIIKEASYLLQSDLNINYTGYVESDQLINCEVDVVVMDGFVGNVVIKAVEGTLFFLRNSIKKYCQDSIFVALLSPIFKIVFRKILQPIKQEAGGLLLGVSGIVVKVHGNASVSEYTNVLDMTIKSVNNKLLEKVKGQVALLKMGEGVRSEKDLISER